MTEPVYSGWKVQILSENKNSIPHVWIRLEAPEGGGAFEAGLGPSGDSVPGRIAGSLFSANGIVHTSDHGLQQPAQWTSSPILISDAQADRMASFIATSHSWLDQA